VSNAEDGHGAYVRRVAQDTQRYAEELLGENHKLRLRVAALESEQQRWVERTRSAETVMRHNDDLKGQLAALAHERVALQERLLDACRVLDQKRREYEGLRESVRRAEAQGEAFAAQYRELEEQNTNLANLYVASYQIHGTLDPAEVLARVQEIVCNLVGCEEMALFETDEAGELVLRCSTGVEAGPLRGARVGRGRIGAAALSGDVFVAEGDAPGDVPPEEHTLTACIPLKLGDRVSGVIALFRLLPQKRGIEALDRELFDLLATHAASALYCAALHASREEARHS
jgi:hypothetical protein